NQRRSGQLLPRPQHVGDRRPHDSDAQGWRLRTLACGPAPPGTYEVVWAGSIDAGRPVGPGLYFARLSVLGRKEMRELLRVRYCPSVSADFAFEADEQPLESWGRSAQPGVTAPSKTHSSRVAS